MAGKFPHECHKNSSAGGDLKNLGRDLSWWVPNEAYSSSMGLIGPTLNLFCYGSLNASLVNGGAGEAKSGGVSGRKSDIPLPWKNDMHVV